MSRSSLRGRDERTAAAISGPTILVFTEGTILIHASGAGLPREEVVNQVRAGRDPSLEDFARYVAIGNGPAKLSGWKRAGAIILYLTSRRDLGEVRAIRQVLHANHFPRGRLLSRRKGEGYAEVAERERPDVIVEDDCESIGGEMEMTYPHIRQDARSRIRSVVVREFGGIDHLPDDPVDLQQTRAGSMRPGRGSLL